MKPEDDKLNEMLKRAAVPERSPGYWEAFPKRVTRQLTGEPAAERPVLSWAVWGWGGGLAAACVLLAIGLAFWPRSEMDATAQYAKIYREMEATFPNQVRSIICDENGVHLDLADKAEVPDSPPVLLTVCAKSQPCREIITFSGQKVRLDGDSCDVLSDGSGHVLVVGNRFVWSSEKGRAPVRAGHDREIIEAQRL
jgi:hypothetical protein